MMSSLVRNSFDSSLFEYHYCATGWIYLFLSCKIYLVIFGHTITMSGQFRSRVPLGHVKVTWATCINVKWLSEETYLKLWQWTYFVFVYFYLCFDSRGVLSRKFGSRDRFYFLDWNKVQSATLTKIKMFSFVSRIWEDWKAMIE